MLYSNVGLRPEKMMIGGKLEYCICLGGPNSVRPLILICDKDTRVQKGMNKNLSIEYYNNKFFKIRNYKETTCYFLICANIEKGNKNGKIKITKKEYPHCSILAKGYDSYDIADIQKKADYVLLRSPSWYGIVRVKTINKDGFYNNIYVVRNSKVYEYQTKELLRSLQGLGIEEDFVIYENGNFDGNYWVTI